MINAIKAAASVSLTMTVFLLACLAMAFVLSAGLAYVGILDRRQARTLDAYQAPHEDAPTTTLPAAPATVNLKGNR